MKIPLNKEMKIILLKAVKAGELDTFEFEGILKEIRGRNEFLELMKEATAIDNKENHKIEVIGKREQVEGNELQ